jgi:hypothetical protein
MNVDWKKKTYHGDTETRRRSGIGGKSKTLPLIYTDNTDPKKIGGSGHRGIGRQTTYRGSARMNAD